MANLALFLSKLLMRIYGLYGNSDNFILYICIGYYILMCFLAPGFFSVNNSWNLLHNLLPLLIVAIGQTYVILTSGIDLSATAIIALTSVVGGYLMTSDNGFSITPIGLIVLGMLTMVVTGAVTGFLNGIAIVKLGMPPFMVTLTTMMFFGGFAIWLTKSQNIHMLPEEFVALPYDSLLGIPIPLIFGLVILLLAYFILNKTLLGEWIFAVGLSAKVALVSGIRVHRTIIFTYIFSGICAAIASILYTARLETGSPVMGQNILLDIIGAVIIGGTSLFGGKGKIRWTVYGVLFITLLDNSLNLIGLSFFMIMIIKGLVILMAALLNVLKEKQVQPNQ